jgi:hypothetical protein
MIRLGLEPSTYQEANAKDWPWPDLSLQNPERLFLTRRPLLSTSRPSAECLRPSRSSVHTKRSSSFHIVSDLSCGWTALSFWIRAELSRQEPIRHYIRSPHYIAPCLMPRLRT